MPLTRRTMLRLLSGAALLPHTLRAAKAPGPRLWIGTGTDATGSHGIYVADWDPATGTLGEPLLALALTSPTFLARNAESSRLYAISEATDGTVHACSAQPTGALVLINTQAAQGAGPAHISVHPGGRAVFVANYGGGSITSYAVREDGGLSAPVSHFRYAEPGRQSHAHAVTPSPDGRWLLVNDLGLDRILVYHVDPATAVLTANDPPGWSARAGSGPRHLAFHPNGRWCYSVNESDSTVDLLQWDTSTGRLGTLGPFVSTLPPGWPPHTAFCSEILMSPDGAFVYVGNRRNETIAMLSVDAQNGSLTLRQLAPHGGKTARHLTLDPGGRWLLVADQDSGGIVVLRRNPHTGLLSAPTQTRALASPQCLVFST